MKKSIFIFFFLFIGAFSISIAQTSSASGVWTTGSNWVGGTAPTPGGIGANVIVNHSMTFASGASFTGWGSTTITINSGASVTITGDMDMQGSGISIIINTGGTLDVSGTLSVNNQSQITMSGGTLKAGTLTMTDNATSKFNYTSGTLTLTGSLYVGAGETFSYSSSLSIPGSVTILNGAAITATTLGGNISLSGSSKLTLNTGGTVSPTTITYGGSNSEIVLSSGTLSYASTALTINGGNKLTINAGTANLQSLTIGSAGTVTVASGASATATALTTTSNSDAILTNNGTFTVNGNISSDGSITNNGTLQVNGNLTQGNSGNQFNNYKNVTVTGNATANGLIQLYPNASSNSEFVVNGNMTVNANPWLLVGTDISSCGSSITYYADAVIKGNLVLTGSGDVTVKQNGRLVVFGNIDGTSSSGTLVTINCGGQAYVNGKIDITTGGGNTVTNSNSASSPTGSDSSPVIGLYVNGTTTAQTTSGTIGTKAQLKSNDLPFYNYIAGLSGSPLPITLVSFKASLENEIIHLTWSTSFEKNFDKFVIERSSNGSVFESIGEVKGVGNTTIIQNYSIDDVNPLLGKNYYRLKSVDLDNSFEYSKVIYVEFDGSKNFSIYPNPSAGEFVHFVVNFEPQANDKVEVIDFAGSTVTNATIDNTSNEIIFNDTLKQGTYILKYTSGSFQRIEKIVIR
ncbi:MAG TPA: T9SS type A sorting domain-containing protein [Cyclobacteriaceae bacterium]|nr:T9SS type A sorting domain-containing protein [Cyclobacteriaceae bacterium]